MLCSHINKYSFKNKLQCDLLDTCTMEWNKGLMIVGYVLKSQHFLNFYDISSLLNSKPHNVIPIIPFYDGRKTEAC